MTEAGALGARRRRDRHRHVGRRRRGAVRPAAGAARGAAGRGVRSCCICRASGPACWSTSSRPSARCRFARPRTRSRSSAGTIYFAPPDYHLLVDVGPRSRSPPTSRSISRARRSTCCSSRRRTSTERLLGIILTGASEDGAAGLEAVRRAGGATIVQEPGARRWRMMAESALKRGQVDLVLSLEQLADLLRTLDATPRPEGHDRMQPPVKCLLVDDREENLLALSRAASARRRRAAGSPVGRGGARAAPDARRRAGPARRPDAGHGRLRAGRADARQRPHPPRADHLRHRRRAGSAPGVQGLRNRRGRLPATSRSSRAS